MNMKKKLISLMLAGAMSVLGAGALAADFAADKDITVISREDGSGTRGAFVELFGVEQKNEEGKKIDYTTDAAVITNATSVMMTTVAGDVNAIGYISLGSMNETVKALKIDGAEATVESIKSGEYKIARPFNVALSATASEGAKDFLNFILSEEGQAVVAEGGFIPNDEKTAYEDQSTTDKIVVAGSSSITPIMEKLKEAYTAINPDAVIEVQQSDSTTGMNAAIDGICDIGMASRALKDSEIEKGLTPTVIATDGIAVIVNVENPTEELSSESVCAIYTGEALTWADVL
jgi:phosphate transport system substrate-binding protein